MTNLSGTNLDARSAPAGAAPRMAPISFLCTLSPFTVPTSDHRASPCLASSPPGSAFYDVYSPHPRGSPCGPAFGSSNPLPADWCARGCGATPSCFACNSGPTPSCARRSRLLSRRSPFGHPLAGLPLPSASSYIRPYRGHYRYSYRGLPPHQFMPMPGVPRQINSDAILTGARIAPVICDVMPNKAQLPRHL